MIQEYSYKFTSYSELDGFTERSKIIKKITKNWRRFKVKMETWAYVFTFASTRSTKEKVVKGIGLSHIY